LLDTACARIKVNLSSKPDFIEDRERRLQMLEREKRGLMRDAENRIPVSAERLAEIDAEVATVQQELDELRARFEAQHALARKILELRAQRAGSPDGADDLEAALIAAEQEFAALQAEEKLIFIDVSPDTVAKVVSDRTGIPLGKMMRDQASAALTLEATLAERIKGQPYALSTISEVLKSARSGIQDPNQPMGIFLLVGPSGTGKTETALTIADTMFGGEQSLV